MSQMNFPDGGTKTPTIWMRIRCRLVYGKHFFISPNNDTRSWCGRCGILHSFVPMPPQERAPEPVPILILQGTPPKMMRPMPQVPKAKSPINATIKDHVVWLVDEYRTRKEILPHVALDEPQLDELIGGIVDVIGMYEGVYIDSKKRPDLFDEDDEDEEGSGKTA